MFQPTLRAALRSAIPLVALVLASCSSGGGGGAFVFDAAEPEGASVGEAWTWDASVKGAKGPVTYSLATAPAGMAVDSDGMVAWTPSLANLGPHPIRVEATDDNETIEREFDLHVDQGILLGVTLSPRGHTDSGIPDDFTDHLADHAPWGRVIAFHSTWRQSVEEAGTPPNLALVGVSGALTYGYTPVIGLGWASGEGEPDLTSESEPANNSWSNAETRAEYLDMVRDFAEEWQPPYLFLGNETNVYFLTHTQGEWDDWVSEYEACYDAVKAVSPDTVVFTVFQYERMAGLGAGTAGWTDPLNFELIDDFASTGRLDVLGLTSYPFFEHAAPSAIPDTYYDELANHWTGPVFFTEIVWKAEPFFFYPGSATDQADFIGRFFDLTAGLDLGYAAWLFLHDWDQEDTVQPFAKVGLRDNQATEIRPADAVWRAAVELREIRGS